MREKKKWDLKYVLFEYSFTNSTHTLLNGTQLLLWNLRLWRNIQHLRWFTFYTESQQEHSAQRQQVTPSGNPRVPKGGKKILK